ncbi:hypothetical protein JD844_020166 [Phrynosoma platyrhinos]|uniref:DUF4795 domain-containing protein n=1 Tax=Phrynosoma platyrhinos TaxID=52577 RepID=A0ABQ7TR48_PHRPL|nr:hypothetical protein JD844_020166 [Phrynosoma platyrhinos]
MAPAEPCQQPKTKEEEEEEEEEEEAGLAPVHPGSVFQRAQVRNGPRRNKPLATAQLLGTCASPEQPWETFHAAGRRPPDRTLEPWKPFEQPGPGLQQQQQWLLSRSRLACVVVVAVVSLRQLPPTSCASGSSSRLAATQSPKEAMSHIVSFSELVNLAIGTPELGHVNFNALHLFLHSLLDYFQLKDVKREITDDEMDFIKPASALPATATPSSETVPVAKKSSSIFHQMHERILAIEKQLSFLNSTPDTDQLLTRTQGSPRPAQDMWQMMQLKKKMEVNEEGMTKAMNTLQDLLSNICSLRAATNNVEEELGQLKSSFTKLGIDEMKEQLQQLDRRTSLLDGMQEQMGHPLPLSQQSPLAQVQADMLSFCFSLFPAISEMMPELKLLMEQMERMQRQEAQRKESLQGTMEQVQQLKEQCEKLQRGLDRLNKSTSDMEAMRMMLEQLDITKADKALIQEEMNVKADKSALEAKVNHGELQSATTQLSEMMQDLLQKMSLQDKDWQKALEKLFTDMDCKLDRMALDPLSRQLEEVWKHMITVRKVPLRPRPASANGYEYLARPQRKDSEGTETVSNPPPQTCWQCQAHHQACNIKRLSRSQDLGTIYPYGDPMALTYDNVSPKAEDTEDTGAGQGSGAGWPCRIQPKSRQTEVDILGVNGVLYKGRLSSQAGERALALQKEFAAVKPPRPPSRMERARSAFADVSISPYAAASSIRRIGPAPNGSNRRGAEQPQQPQLTLESMDGTVTAMTTSLSQPFQNGGGVAGM